MKKKDILWAPWRETYITNLKKNGCFLCEALKDKRKGADRKNHILYRGKYVFVILNLFPYNNGHLMIAPNRHLKDIWMFTENEDMELMLLLKASVRIIKRVMKAQAFNVGVNLGGVAGAGLEDHIHFHIVPRWSKDTNFMPVVAQAKVVSQSLEKTYRLLKPEFDKISPPS